MIDREPTPDEAERLDTHTSKLDVCGSPFYVRAHTRGSLHTPTPTHTHEKSSRHANPIEREEYMCVRLIVRPYLPYFSIVADATYTLFHYFRVKARSLSVPPSRFRLYVFPRRYACSLIFCSAETLLIDSLFFTRASALPRWMAIGWNRSFTQREPTIRFESFVSCSVEEDIEETRTWLEKGPQELEEIDKY